MISQQDTAWNSSPARSVFRDHRKWKILTAQCNFCLKSADPKKKYFQHRVKKGGSNLFQNSDDAPMMSVPLSRDLRSKCSETVVLSFTKFHSFNILGPNFTFFSSASWMKFLRTAKLYQVSSREANLWLNLGPWNSKSEPQMVEWAVNAVRFARLSLPFSKIFVDVSSVWSVVCVTGLCCPIWGIRVSF